MDKNELLAGALTDLTMDLAIKDKTAEYNKQQQMKNKQKVVHQDDDKPQKQDPDSDDDMDDFEKEIMEKMRLEKLQHYKDKQGDLEQEQQKAKKQNLWYGEYTDIVESEFLPYVTKAPFAVCHFTHPDFERCKIIDMHLRKIAPEHKECKFLRLDAEKSPFFINKLAIKVLPTICLFKNGILYDQIVGFEELGGKDDFKTIDLVRRMVKAGVLKPLNKHEKGFQLKRGADDSSDEEDDY